MPDPSSADHVAEALVLASDLTTAFGKDLRLRRQEKRGHLHRFYRGQYVLAARWREFTPDERYQVLVRGAAQVRRGSMPVSHQSAAVLWGLPILVPWPPEVHFLIERTAGGRSDPGIRKHAVGIDPTHVTARDGVLLTTIARTVVDLAATVDIKSAVAAVDRALAVDRYGRVPVLTSKAELLDTWERMLPFRGSVRARAIIDFGTHLSGSSSESGSRVNIALNGFPVPELQHPFEIDGRHVETDFYWREFDSVGECDGRGKYFDPVLLDGMSAAEVVYAEKVREDAIRRQVRGFTRWDTPTGLSQARLRARLLELGLPAGRPWLMRG